MGETRVRVFISHAWDKENPHCHDVRALAEILAANGIDARLNLFVEHLVIDWPAWVIHQLEEVDYVIVAASPEYQQRVDDPAGFEAAMLRDRISDGRSAWPTKILTVLLPGIGREDIPQFLSPNARSSYPITDFTRAGIEDVLRVLYGQPKYLPPPPSRRPDLPPAPPALTTLSPSLLDDPIDAERPVVDAPPPPARPDPVTSRWAYTPQPYRSRRSWPAKLRALWTLVAGESWMNSKRRVRLATTRLALLAVAVVSMVTFVRHADLPAVDHLTWLSAVGAAAVACAGAVWQKEWMFSTSVAIVVAASWALVRSGTPDEFVDVAMALLLGMLLVMDRVGSWSRAPLFRIFAVVASVAVAISWAYQRLYEGYDWWPALLDRLRWFLPSIVALAQLSWEFDRDARRVSGAMVVTFGGLFSTWAALSLTGAESDLAGTPGHRWLDLVCGLVVLAGGATALRPRRWPF